MTNKFPSSPISKPSGIAGYNYYPITAEALQEQILSQGDFVSISEVSRFASALVKLVANQSQEIAALKLALNDLRNSGYVLS